MSELDDYIDAHIDPEPPHLHRLYRHTHLSRLYPRMCSDHAQGRLLSMLAGMIRPRAVLELGTFTGYSTLCFAEGLAPGGHIDSVELDGEYADDLLALFAAEAPGTDIRLHIGDAEQIMPQLLRANDYDLVFVDANKRRYPEYLELLLPHMRAGAYILADNTLWDDKVTNPAARDPQTDGIRRFNDLVAANPALSKIILPVRDGLTLIRVLPDPSNT